MKDHFTHLVHLAPLLRKRPHEVAFECDCHLSFVGCPIVFQTDNGTEFQSQVLQKMKELNPSSFCVTGCPCTPCDQGSVERVNSGIKEIISKMVQHAKSETQDPKEKERSHLGFCVGGCTAVNEHQLLKRKEPSGAT